MRAKDREFIKDETGRRVESLLRRLSQVRTLIVPRLRPDVSFAALRRLVMRLRSGAIRPVDPRVSPLLLADMIEQAVAQEILIKELAKEAIEYGRMSAEMRQKYEAERARRVVNDFHRLKKSPEAADPESRVAERVRAIDRARRKELGRRGRRKKR